MLRNYLKTALRNLNRNRGYALINITGLAVGIAACMLIFLTVQFEGSFDNFHKSKERIYRVSTERHGPAGVSYTRGIGFPVGKQLRLDFPQLENVASIFGSQGDQVTVMDEANRPTQKKFTEDGLFFAEPQFFDIFNFPFLAGNPKTALSAPSTAVLTQRAAEKYFGDWKNAMGKTIKVKENKLCKITGILQNPPANTDFPLQVVLSFKTSDQDTSHDWVSTHGDLNTFVVLPNTMTQAQFNTALLPFGKKHIPADYTAKMNYVSQQLSDIHFNKTFGTYRGTFSKELITALNIIGLFLLVIACINFINLATAQAVNRAKEVGIRKVLGSKKQQLVLQFLSETFIITLAATLIAVAIAATLLPLLNNLLETQIALSFSFTNIAFVVAAILLVTLLSGLYPAVILSGFNPITALKTRFTGKVPGGISLRRALVVLQFVVAQVLIIGVITVVSQMNFFKTASMGFDKDAVVTVGIPGDSISLTKTKALKQQLQQQPGIRNVSFATFAMSDDSHWGSDFTFDNSPKVTDFNADLKWADADVFKTYNLQVIAGRPYYQSDTVNEFVVNETLVKKLGLRSPQDIIGKQINFWGMLKARVVGVVKDFNGTSMAKPIAPVVMAPWLNSYQTMAIKIQPQNTQQTLAAIEKIWNASYPEFIYQYKFLDEKIAAFYKQENELSQLYKIFAGIAIFISCLGLYGLVSFMAVQRTKEVGIRKVLGASIASIVYLFSKEFTLLIAIAFGIAAPLAYYFMHQWLQGFTFRVSLSAGIFIITIAASVTIAWLTVGYRALRAAMANPTKSLRSE